VLRAINVMKTGSDPLQAALEARRLSDEALRLDPNLLLALLVRGSTLQTQLEMDPHADHDRLVEELDVLSNRAVAVSRDDQRAWQLRAVALVWQGRLEAALEANGEAARLDPKSAGAIVQRAALKIAMGQSAETLELIDKAIALDPKVAGALNTLGVRCDAFLRLGRYDDAIAACSQAEAQNDSWEVHLLLVAAFAQKGEAARAADEKTMLLKLRPGYTIAEFKALNQKINNPIYLQQTETHLFAGLRKAGIPEQ
jgi:tetratricopeptide (TPR) repeat protein